MAIEERNPENCSVVEGNEIGTKWSEIGNEGGDCYLKGKNVIEDYEDGWGVNWDDIIEDFLPAMSIIGRANNTIVLFPKKFSICSPFHLHRRIMYVRSVDPSNMR